MNHEMQQRKKIGRKLCCENMGVKKGPWSPEEDELLLSYIQEHGSGRWHDIPKFAGLHRCGKSCRLRWTNYLRPDIKKGHLTPEEENLIIQLHATLGNKWASIASHLPGRTDNDIKNVWNTHLKKRLVSEGADRQGPEPPVALSGLMIKSNLASLNGHTAQWESGRLEAEARFSKESQYYDSWTQMKKPYVDPFLRFWNSEVGEAFRRVGGKSSSQSPVISQASSSAKHGSISGTTGEIASNLAASSATPCDIQDEDVKSFIHCGNNILDWLSRDEDVKPFIHHGKNALDLSSNQDEDVKPFIHYGKSVLDWFNEDEDVKPVIHSAENILDCSRSKSTEDSSEFILGLLLDFPSSDDDLIFSENHANYYNISADGA